MPERGLPDKVVHIDALRINRGIAKRCQCEDRAFVVDTRNRSINCGTCGAFVDPFDAMLELAEHGERLERETAALLAQRREIAAYKPHRLVIRSLERDWQGGKMLPTCPRCRKPFRLEDIRAWVGAQFAGGVDDA